MWKKKCLTHLFLVEASRSTNNNNQIAFQMNDNKHDIYILLHFLCLFDRIFIVNVFSRNTSTIALAHWIKFHSKAYNHFVDLSENGERNTHIADEFIFGRQHHNYFHPFLSYIIRKRGKTWRKKMQCNWIKCC